jgi:hypothetical protein
MLLQGISIVRALLRSGLWPNKGFYIRFSASSYSYVSFYFFEGSTRKDFAIDHI